MRQSEIREFAIKKWRSRKGGGCAIQSWTQLRRFFTQHRPRPGRRRTIYADDLLAAPDGQRPRSGLGQGDAHLALVLAAAIFIAGFAHFVGFKEQHLRAAFASVNLGRQRRGVAELQRHIAFPFRLERGDVDDDAAAGVGALAQADGEHIARDAEVFHRARQGKRIGRNDTNVAGEVDKIVVIKIFRVNDGAVDIGENLEKEKTSERIENWIEQLQSELA